MRLCTILMSIQLLGRGRQHWHRWTGCTFDSLEASLNRSSHVFRASGKSSGVKIDCWRYFHHLYHPIASSPPLHLHHYHLCWIGLSQERQPEQARDVQLYDIIADPQVETDEYDKISNPTSTYYRGNKFMWIWEGKCLGISGSVRGSAISG